jgi:hypothetical protein
LQRIGDWSVLMLMKLLVSITFATDWRLQMLMKLKCSWPTHLAHNDEIEVLMSDPVCNRLEAVDVDEIRFFVRNLPDFLFNGLDFKKNHEKHSWGSGCRERKNRTD